MVEVEDLRRTDRKDRFVSIQSDLSVKMCHLLPVCLSACPYSQHVCLSVCLCSVLSVCVYVSLSLSLSRFTQKAILHLCPIMAHFVCDLMLIDISSTNIVTHNLKQDDCYC